MTPPELAALTGLVGVISSAILSIYSVRLAARQAKAARAQQYLVALSPRVNDAYELAWRVVFEAESQGKVADDLIESMVSQSLWLPADLRSLVLKVLTSPNGQHDFPAMREKLFNESGAKSVSQASNLKELQ